MCLQTDNHPDRSRSDGTWFRSGQHLTTGLGYAGENDCVVVTTSSAKRCLRCHSAAAVLTHLITSRAVAAINKVELGPDRSYAYHGQER